MPTLIRMTRAPSPSDPRPPHANQAPPPADARDAAYRVLSAHAKTFPDLMPVEPQIQHLEPRDRALCHAIIRESVTRWITLRYIVTELAGRGFETIEPRMQGVLIGAAAQLLLLDRLPPHAVINESVEWAKQYIRPKAGGMTNAILRKVARTRGDAIDSYSNQSNTIPLANGSALVLNNLNLPEDPLTHTSTAYSLPKATIKRWTKLYPDRVNQLVSHTLIHPPTLVYTQHWTEVPDQEDLAPHDSLSHRVYTGSRTHLTRLLDANPSLRVQDPASSSVVQSIPDGNYNTIIDYCAGQGTKTRQLVERFPNATIIAMEIDSRRLDTLMDVFDDNRSVLVRHVDELAESVPNGADLILTDVPCSNSGVLARRMEARYRPMTIQVSRIAKIQQDILSTVIPYLNPEGTLVYSTCSIEPEENQDQRDWIKEDSIFELIEDHQVLPSATPSDPASMYTDGSYASIFKKLK
ncbi:MAG: transcription antitermination factor NusB [Phycisphaerales bacterium]|nr:transcription antitermination factor NusB [Phycisphaerales bacterium]